jgi:hypothetical protein
MLPSGTLAGGSVSGSVLDDAKGLVERIRARLAAMAKHGLDAYVGADAWALRKAAGVVASGAKKAAAYVTEPGPIKDELAKLASDAWALSAGPLLILGGALLLMSSDNGKASKSDPLTMGAMLWAAAKFLL